MVFLLNYDNACFCSFLQVFETHETDDLISANNACRCWSSILVCIVNIGAVRVKFSIDVQELDQFKHKVPLLNTFCNGMRQLIPQLQPVNWRLHIVTLFGVFLPFSVLRQNFRNELKRVVMRDHKLYLKAGDPCHELRSFLTNRRPIPFLMLILLQ